MSLILMEEEEGVTRGRFLSVFFEVEVEGVVLVTLLGLFALGAGMDVGVDVGVGRALLLRCLCASLVGVRARLGL